MSTLLSTWTLLAFVFFVGVILWVTVFKRKEDFEEAANIPFTEEIEKKSNTTKEINNG